MSPTSRPSIAPSLPEHPGGDEAGEGSEKAGVGIQTGPARATRGSRARQTRARILDAAGIRFAEAGYAETRLEDVGRDVGIGRSAVLYHFRDKKLLYQAVLEDLFRDLLETQRACLMADGPLADRLEKALSEFVEYMGCRPTAARLALRELIGLDPEIRDDFEARVRPYLGLLEMLFEEGERTGVFRPARSDPFHFVSTVMGSTLFYVAALPTLVRQLPYDPLSTEQLELHKRDVLETARRLLGIRGPRPLRDGDAEKKDGTKR